MLADVLLNENTRMNLTQLLKWFWKYESTFRTILSAKHGLICKSFDRHMRNKLLLVRCGYPHLIAGCMTGDRDTQAEILLCFSKKLTVH